VEVVPTNDRRDVLALCAYLFSGASAAAGLVASMIGLFGREARLVAAVSLVLNTGYLAFFVCAFVTTNHG
jgi:hypothetical protein